jgi:hypothetical protein
VAGELLVPGPVCAGWSLYDHRDMGWAGSLGLSGRESLQEARSTRMGKWTESGVGWVGLCDGGSVNSVYRSSAKYGLPDRLGEVMLL